MQLQLTLNYHNQTLSAFQLLLPLLQANPQSEIPCFLFLSYSFSSSSSFSVKYNSFIISLTIVMIFGKSWRLMFTVSSLHIFCLSFQDLLRVTVLNPTFTPSFISLSLNQRAPEMLPDLQDFNG